MHHMAWWLALLTHPPPFASSRLHAQAYPTASVAEVSRLLIAGTQNINFRTGTAPRFLQVGGWAGVDWWLSEQGGAGSPAAQKKAALHTTPHENLPAIPPPPTTPSAAGPAEPHRAHLAPRHRQPRARLAVAVALPLARAHQLQDISWNAQAGCWVLLDFQAVNRRPRCEALPP